VPCEEIIPEVKNLYSKNFDKIDLITIMEEKTKDRALQFFKVHQILWNQSYENIDCTNCLKTRMKVKVFTIG